MLKEPRFWITLAIIAGAAVLAALGKVSGDAFGALVVGLLARWGADKAAEPVVRAAIPLLLVGALLGGCTWQQATKTSADVAGSLATSARTVGDPAFAADCNAKLVKCSEARDGICEPLKQCQAQRHTFNTVLVGIHTARYGAYSAILVGDKKKAEGWVSALKDAGTKIEAALRALKVIP